MSDMMHAQMKAEQATQEALNQTEELKSQEEELRQNMEELAATQDEMQRILNEVQGREGYMKALINSAKDAIFTVDRDLAIISFNDGFTVGLKQMGIEMVAGFKLLDIFPDEKQKSEQRAYYKRAFAGEAFDITTQFDINGTQSHYNSSYSPLRNEQGEVFAIAVFGKDVTEIFDAKLKAERLAKDAQEKNEEMKAQEEELRQNMEELSATQEEMQRVMRETEAKATYTNDLINASDDLICTIDRRHKLINWNKTFADFSQSSGGVTEKGFDTLQWYPEGKERDEYRKMTDRAFQGESVTFSRTMPIGDKEYAIATRYKPLGQVDGIYYEIVMFTRLTPVEKKNGKSEMKKAG
jgi:PAS domain S-box-containing protein